MPAKKKAARKHADDLRGAGRLLIDATERVTAVVESMHRTIAGGPAVLGRPLDAPARAVTGLVYGGIRGVTRAVGAALDLTLSQLTPLLGASAPGAERASVQAALNGVIGDHLRASGNPLAITMQLFHDGAALDATPPPPAHVNGKLLLLLHGSSMSEQQWQRGGHDHGAALARDLGYTPLYLRYNSGLHVSENGRELDALLEQTLAAWPAPITELTLLGHSMGGLVARSACHVAEEAGHAWRARLTRLVCVGTPHHGAPLERGGNWLQWLLGVNRYSAPLQRLGKLRSAGVTDLRYGYVLDAHWHGRDQFDTTPDPRRSLALPAGVACYALAATLTPPATPANKKATRKLRSDGLVPVDSALGRHAKPALTLAFPEAHQWIGYGLGHLDLLDHPEVYQTLRRWLARE